MAVTLANRSIGAVAIPYDYVSDNMLNDFNSDAGFMVAFFHALDLRLGAGSLIGVVCSSYGYPNSGTANRDAANGLGATEHLYIRQANKMVARAVILIVVLQAKGIFWILEQPCGSRLEFHPAFQWLANIMAIYRTCFEAGRLGASSMKRLWMYSNHEYLSKLVLLIILMFDYYAFLHVSPFYFLYRCDKLSHTHHRTILSSCQNPHLVNPKTFHNHARIIP